MNTNLLEAARLSRAKKVLYTSSIGAYSQASIFRESDDTIEKPPMDMYPGWAKRMAEFQIKAYRQEFDLNNFSVVRPANVYGPGDNFDPENSMVIPALMARINSGENPLSIWGDGSAVRDFAFSRDIAYGLILAMHFGTGNGFINLGSGKATSIKQLVETLNSFIDFDYEFDSGKSAGFSSRVMDISKAQELLGYNPSTSLKTGLKETWEWYQQNQSEYLSKINYFKE
jgi:GDP-L-fucose synthase